MTILKCFFANFEKYIRTLFRNEITSDNFLENVNRAAILSQGIVFYIRMLIGIIWRYIDCLINIKKLQFAFPWFSFRHQILSGSLKGFENFEIRPNSFLLLKEHLKVLIFNYVP